MARERLASYQYEQILEGPCAFLVMPLLWLQILRVIILFFVESFQHDEACISSNANLAICDRGNSTRHKQSMKEFFSSCMEKTTDNKCQSDEIFFSPKQSGKRITWEASVSALNSKRVKGSHVLNHGVCPMKNCDSLQIEGNDACFAKRPNQESVDQINCPRIMFMDIIDDDKRSRLMKIVEELGGSVARTATSSTHLITGKARRTLNFCLSLCSGVWIVSPSWLKSSFRVGRSS
ncbi:hypothetical protein HPP92_002854 [Vanilla planifolia]|uniref:BRCT domain-containing protein n=1 Tax=Vanilla planifolia TaxID=51239 RepID=A0A835SEI4_VANPL|nr:hypothetical protein HPP92_002854 [Vanilla planifolia]